MSTNNLILASDNQPEIINLPQGIPTEQEIKPVANNSSSSQEPQNPEAERILSPNAQQPIVREPTQEYQGANTRMFTKKTSILFLIDCSIKIIFFLIQFYMLGDYVTFICIGVGLAYYDMAVFCLLCEYICSGLDQGSCLCAKIHFKMQILPCIGAFILSIIFLVRYTFNNPEAIDIVNVYTRLFQQNYHSDDESSANSSLKRVGRFIICKMCAKKYSTIAFRKSQKKLHLIIVISLWMELFKIIISKIQTQSKLMVLQGLTLIFQFFIIYLQLKNTKQYLSFFPIAPTLNASDLG